MDADTSRSSVVAAAAGAIGTVEAEMTGHFATRTVDVDDGAGPFPEVVMAHWFETRPLRDQVVRAP